MTDRVAAAAITGVGPRIEAGGDSPESSGLTVDEVAEWLAVLQLASVPGRASVFGAVASSRVTRLFVFAHDATPAAAGEEPGRAPG